jgi:protein TonB
VTKLQKGDFFVSKLIVVSVTFGRKTKKSQPPTGAARLFLPGSVLRTSRAAKWRNLSSIDRVSLLVFAFPGPATNPRELPPTHGVQQSEARASLTSLRARRRPTEARSQETGAANSTTSHFQRRPVVSSNPKPKEIPEQENDLGSLRSCLVEGDPAQITRNRRLRRRSLLLSVILQFAVLTALILVPLLSKTEPLPAGMVMPMPPYHRPVGAVANNHPHPAPPKRGFSFCLTCPPVLPHPTTNTNNSSRTTDDQGLIVDGSNPDPDCPGCIPLLGNNTPQPAIPRPPTPRIVHVTHIDPALLIQRVEPAYPPLARQIRREGTVELHAIIANDGSIRSLQVVEGDAFFYQSALDAVRQWRYKPTVLNGLPVEVDTHITVIYKLNH